MKGTVKKELELIIRKTINEIWPNLKGIPLKIKIDYPPSLEWGNYSSNAPFCLTSFLNISSWEIASLIKEKLDQNAEIRRIFDKIVVAREGFLNFFIKEDFWLTFLVNLVKAGSSFGNSQKGKNKKVNLEFISANPTGPIHLGNSRGGPVGDVLANLLEKMGFEVWREYYVNDAGNQIEILGHSILGDENGQYQGQYLEKVKKQLLKEKKIRVKEEKELVFKLGQKAAKIILEEYIKPATEKMGIKFDAFFLESELYQKGEIEMALEKLKEKKLIYQKGGALWFKATQFGDEKDRVVKKKDGKITYFGADIAYHLNKFQRGFDWAINVWGADHHGDVKRLKGALEALCCQNKLSIVLVQFVHLIKDGQEIKMSKRKGTYVTIDDLIKEVGKDVVRFFFLMHAFNTHINFDLNLAKEKSNKNPVFYVQYAYARISSLIEKSSFKKEALIDFGENWKKDFQESDLKWSIEEKKLLLFLLKFPELLEEIAESFEIHLLTRYAIDLADHFHSFYQNRPILKIKDDFQQKKRLILVWAVRVVLREVLRILGVTAPQRM